MTLSGGPLHGEEYTVADALHTVELPAGPTNPASFMSGPTPPTVLYRRNPRNPAVFEYL